MRRLKSRGRALRASPRSRFCRPRVEELEARTLLANAIVAENQLPGSPKSEWDIVGDGDGNIEGFATDISVDQGQTVNFKINTNSNNYRLDIYRMGYYGGMGARKVATIQRQLAQAQNQPDPLTNSATGLVDAGNWAVSASWAVPASATSGIYFAKLVRQDGIGGENHIFFVVRDDNGASDLLFQTSDTTWQAYNNWGGDSLYDASSADGRRAYKVSYNRPFVTRGIPGGMGVTNWVFWAEYPMVRWLEANGYNVSYSTNVDTARRGGELLEHKVFLSVGHDEYWSGEMRTNVEAARDAGVHLAFFSGNEVYWKTRWENSIDASGTPYRTLVTYKESVDDGAEDPTNVWTGLWRDMRRVPPGDTVLPEQLLTGQIFSVNRGAGGDFGTAIKVPEPFGKMRFWRNTSVATLQPGQVATLANGTLGYEWDEDVDNGFRPGGIIPMSSTTEDVPEKLVDPISWPGCGGVSGTPCSACRGCMVAAGTATHTLVMYRAPSGALVFGAGTVQWSFGLDGNHDGQASVPDTRMRQATVNLFADMGVQPESLQSGLLPATASADATAPTSTITSPAAGSTVQSGTPITITGTAAEAGGGRLAVVEVSTDNGVSWRRATGTSSWSYSWTPSASGTAVIKSRAVDDSVNLETPKPGVSVTVSSANTLVAAYSFDAGSGSTVADASGKGNSGTISGAAWTAGRYGGGLSFDGIDDWVTVNDASSLDLSGAMTLEAWVRPSAINGWETVLMKETTGDMAYALYADNNGNDSGGPRRPIVSVRQGGNTTWTPGSAQLATNVWSHLAGTYDGLSLKLYVNGTLAGSLPLSGPINVTSGPLRIGGNSIWNEWFSGQIDEVRIYSRVLSQAEIQSDMNTPINSGPDATAPTVSSVTPASGATSVAANTNVTATFSEAMDPATITATTFELRDANNFLVPATVSYNTATHTATLDPNASLALGVTYTARVRGGTGGVKDVAGNALAADFTWSFTTVASAPQPSISIGDVSVTEGDSGSVNAVFTVSLSSSSSQTVSVTYSTANGTATAGSDYTAVPPTTLSFAPGQTSRTVTVAVLGDTLQEPSETFFVNLTSPVNATLADSQGQATIVDNDAPIIGSDAFGYTAVAAPFESLDLVQGASGVITVRSTGDNSTRTVNFPSGNTFNFYGTSFASLIVSTNGLITFSSGTSSATNTDLTTSPSQRAIAPLWDDWEDIMSSAIILARYDDTDASGGPDRLVIEWNAQRAPLSPSPVMFQAILQLNTGPQAGAITFNYADTDSGDLGSHGASATVGIKDAGSQGANRLLVSFNSTSPWVGSGKAIRFAVAADTTPPAVSLTSPAGGATVSGTVSVAANASDNTAVAGVQFLLDGVNLGAEDTAAPYSVSWNTATAANGTHTLTARARDAAGNLTTSAPVTVTVSNQSSGSGGLVAAYGFNEGSGATAGDSSGNANAGTISGATWLAAGRFAGALSFDGASDWVAVADAPSLDLTTGMTLEAWVRPATIDGWETVLMKEASGSYGYGLYADDNGQDSGQPRRPGVWVVQGGNFFGAQGTSQLPVNIWTHLAATYDGAVLRIYLNGTLAGTLNQSGAINVTDGALRIGGNSIWGEWFSGLIDEVRVYNRALSQAEIQSDMETPVGSPLRLLGEATDGGQAAVLDAQDARPLLVEAVHRWSVSLDDPQLAKRLDDVELRIDDLPGSTLAVASGAVIFLDVEASGRGWFIDPTPADDSEFRLPSDQGEQDRVDLLTVLAHEIGHLLGLDHNQATEDPGNVMGESLPAGMRRMPEQGPEFAAVVALFAVASDSRPAAGSADAPVARQETNDPSDALPWAAAMRSRLAAASRPWQSAWPLAAGPPRPVSRENLDLADLDDLFADLGRLLDDSLSRN